MDVQQDLSFREIVNPEPGTLTPDQIAAYNESGYLCPLDVFTHEEAERNRAYFDSLLERVRSMHDGRDQYSLNGYQSACAGIWDLATEPRILDYVEDMIGPDIVAWATHYFCKMPHDTKAVPWHQDASYWPLTPPRTVTAWLAIDDADEENSAMKFIPGTHRMGHLSWKETSREAVLNQEIEDVDLLGVPVYAAMKAGQISLHADMMAHGSDPNRSARRRCGLTIRYCPPEVRVVKDGWNQNAIICRGSDPLGHWRHNPRPEGDNLDLDTCTWRRVKD